MRALRLERRNHASKKGIFAHILPQEEECGSEKSRSKTELKNGGISWPEFANWSHLPCTHRILYGKEFVLGKNTRYVGTIYPWGTCFTRIYFTPRHLNSPTASCCSLLRSPYSFCSTSVEKEADFTLNHRKKLGNFFASLLFCYRFSRARGKQELRQPTNQVAS